MSIRVECPGCFKSFKVRDTAAGKTLRCPDCREKMVVPEPDDDRNFLKTLDRFDSFGTDIEMPAPPKPSARPKPKKKKKKRQFTYSTRNFVSTERVIQVIGSVMLLEMLIIGLRIVL